MWVRTWVGVCALMLCTPGIAAHPAIEALSALKWGPELRDHVRKGKWNPIWKKQNQGDRDLCGYFALSHALSGFDKNAPSGLEVWELAKKNGWYWNENGRSISKNLVNTAQAMGGYQVEHGWGPTGGTIKYLRTLVRWRFGVLLGIQGATDEGLPERKGVVYIGGHWVALEGFVKIEGVDYLIIKDSNHYGAQPEYIDKWLDGSNLWPVDLFEAAWNVNAYVALKPER